MLKDKESLNILLVEDNLLNQKLMSITFKKLKHKLDYANNGLEGVEKFKAQKYDIILMDLMMPLMDGFEATKEIRKIEQSDNSRVYTPIIAFTANALNNTINKCVENGMDNLMEKPFSVYKFNEIIEFL